VNPSSVNASETIHEESSIEVVAGIVSLKPAGNLKEPLAFYKEMLFLVIDQQQLPGIG